MSILVSANAALADEKASPADGRAAGAPQCPGDAETSDTQQTSVLRRACYADVSAIADPIQRAQELLAAADDCSCRGLYTEALDRLNDASEISDSPVITAKRAAVEEVRGRYTRAVKLYESAARASAADHDAETATAAESRRGIVRGKLASVTLSIEPPDVCVRVDGRALEPDPASSVTFFTGTAASEASCLTPAGTRVLLLDPGEPHVFLLTHPRAEGDSFELTLKSKELGVRRVTLERPLRRYLSFVSLGLGVGTLFAGAWFGITAVERHSRAGDECFGRACSDKGLDLHQEAKLWGDATTGTLAGGAVLTALGIAGTINSQDRLHASPATGKVGWSISASPAGAIVGVQALF